MSVLSFTTSCTPKAQRISLVRWQTGEGEEAVAGFLKAVGDGPVLEPPPADEGFAARFDLFARCRVDHIFVVGVDLFMRALGGVREEITVFMHVMPTSA
jgi:hypothetical protein